MVKLRVMGNRLCLGSWSVPFRRSKGSSSEEIPHRTTYGYMVASAAKKHDMESSPPRPYTPTRITDPETSTSKLIELAQTIMRETEKLNRFIGENELPEPSFDADAPLTFPKLPNELKKSREDVMKATKELGELVTGPRESIRWMAWDVVAPPSDSFPSPISKGDTDDFSSITTRSRSTSSTTTKSPSSSLLINPSASWTLPLSSPSQKSTSGVSCGTR